VLLALQFADFAVKLYIQLVYLVFSGKVKEIRGLFLLGNID